MPIPELIQDLIWSTYTIHRKQVYYYHLGDATEMVFSRAEYELVNFLRLRKWIS